MRSRPINRYGLIGFLALAGALAPLAVPVAAQVPTTASVVWGQGGSFTAHGPNTGGISDKSLSGSSGVAVDGSGNLYVADSSNNRVLYFPAGTTTATQVYGQTSFNSGLVNIVGGTSPAPTAGSLSSPTGVALDANGNLYVADKGNNRVLYYPVGTATARVGTATAAQVYGQGSFITNAANSGGVSAATLDAPSGVALDSSGNLYVADTTNNRVLYYPAAAATATVGTAAATRVYGQAGSFTTKTVNKSGISATSLGAPSGVALDSSGNLYVADTTNNRVLYYPAGTTTATQVWGQSGSFTTGSANEGGTSASADTLDGPGSVALDGSGNLYVADKTNNRLLYYPAATTTATVVYGQGGSFATRFTNDGATPTASTVAGPYVTLDSSGNLYVGDSGNSRVLEFYNAGALSLSATHSTPIYQGGPGSITLTVAITGGATAGAAAITDPLTADFTINSVSSGCSVGGQTVTCTLPSGSSAASTSFIIYVTASTSASTAGIANAPTISDAYDDITSGAVNDTITVSAQLPQVDASFSQVVLSGSTDNGTCAAGKRTLTATDQIQNMTGSTINNPYAEIATLSEGNTLISQSANITSVAPNANVTFTFHIQLASCATFQLFFDVYGD